MSLSLSGIAISVIWQPFYWENYGTTLRVEFHLTPWLLCPQPPQSATVWPIYQLRRSCGGRESPAEPSVSWSPEKANIHIGQTLWLLQIDHDLVLPHEMIIEICGLVVCTMLCLWLCFQVRQHSWSGPHNVLLTWHLQGWCQPHRTHPWCSAFVFNLSELFFFFVFFHYQICGIEFIAYFSLLHIPEVIANGS